MSGRAGASVQLAVVWESGAGLGTAQDHPADTSTSHSRDSVTHSPVVLGYSRIYFTKNCIKTRTMLGHELNNICFLVGASWKRNQGFHANFG